MTIVYALLGILALAALVLIVVAMGRPDSFRIERQCVINAPASRIFAELNDFSRWPGWSPWEKKDPAMKRQLSANTAGEGATYEWWGNKDVGHGRMTITESTPDTRLLIQLHFITPFEAQNVTEFTLVPEGGGMRLTWSMTGKSNFIAKVMCLFFDMEKMVGPDFEAGLMKLKATAEQAG